ncbi:cell division protein ZapA [Hyphomonas sp.]|uniref:cell division protein ZapA n=1 Tax=Hyphomonas sp. TaxID=87 RepID=UPI0025C32996|nr:cell division protein ZapA [Hyphomonas sp.]MBI1400075.1 cell division protein ZapA [Hyphomonas sp.]
MAKADITLRGRTFSIACAPGQEMRVQRLAEQLDTRVRQISDAVGDIGDERLLLITALALMDELDSVRRGVSARPDTEARAVELLIQMAGKVEALAARLENDN